MIQIGSNQHRNVPFVPSQGGLAFSAPRAGRTIDFQPQTTVRIAGRATGSYSLPQPFDAWLDGLDVTNYQILVEVLRAANCQLILETSAVADAPDSHWVEIASYTTSGVSELLNVGSGSESYTDQFQRYIRWRLLGDTSAEAVIHFRLKAIAGSTLEQHPEEPRKL